MNNVDKTVCQILVRAEELYERLGNPLVSATRHRRAWAFARAFGATRLAHELSVPRDTVVTARRRAFARWQYWMTRYEEPLWQVLLRLATEPRQWESTMVRYRRFRALLRQECLPEFSVEPQIDVVLACVLRSLASVTWRYGDQDCWQTVWRLLARRQVARAHAMATTLGWSARQWRRARAVVPRLRALVWYPLSQRQLLALSLWPLSHLVALQETGQALFPTQSCGLADLAQRSPLQIAGIASLPAAPIGLVTPLEEEEYFHE